MKHINELIDFLREEANRTKFWPGNYQDIGKLMADAADALEKLQKEVITLSNKDKNE